MDLPTMRTNLRLDLHDENPAAYQWSDAMLDRHIDRALKEYSQAWPLQASVILPAINSRRYSLAGQPGYLWCERVEYPVDEYPRRFLPFLEDGAASVVVLPEWMPVNGQDVKFWYAQAHTLDASASTIPCEHEELVALGAAGYAALQWAGFAIGRLNVSSEVPERYRAWGEARLQEFRQRLEGLRAARSFHLGPTNQWGEVPAEWAT